MTNDHSYGLKNVDFEAVHKYTNGQKDKQKNVTFNML